MADTNTQFTSLGDTQLDGYYQSLLKTLPNQQISYDPVQLEEQSVESITGQVEKYLRNYYDQSAAERRKATTQQIAELDVDAASRGMGSSTFLSDMKNRQYMAEAADIADLNADYNATLAETVANQYNQYLSNKLNVDFTNRQNQLTVDQWNASSQLAREELAYQRAQEIYERAKAALGSGGGSSSKKSSGSIPPTDTGGEWWYDLNENNQWQIYGDVEQAKKDIAATGATTTSGRLTNSSGTNLLPNYKPTTNLTSGKLGTAKHAR